MSKLTAVSLELGGGYFYSVYQNGMFYGIVLDDNKDFEWSTEGCRTYPEMVTSLNGYFL